MENEANSHKHVVPSKEKFGRAVPLLVIVVVIAALTRFSGLSHPREVYFDETYYANDAVVYLEGREAFRDNLDARYGGTSRASQIVPVGAVPGEISWVHPPLGKWAIAIGIILFGKQPLGWRALPATFGTVAVGLVFVIAWLLWEKRSWAFLAALMVAVDGLEITMSRVAMLDIFAATFMLASFACLLAERHRLTRMRQSLLTSTSGVTDGQGIYPDPTGSIHSYPRQNPDEPWDAVYQDLEYSQDFEYSVQWRDESPRSSLGSKRYLALSGVLMGLALASKLNALFAWVIVVVFALVWYVQLRAPTTRASDAIMNCLPRVLTLLVFVPALVYVISFTRFYVDNAAGSIGKNPLGTLSEFVKLQVNTVKYHSTMRQDHPYKSSPQSWPLMWRPIAFWYHDYQNGMRGHILAVGNPVLWWSYLLCFPALLGLIVAKRRWQDIFVLAGYAGQYLPWFASSRTAFFYYMLPVVPFMALTIVSVVGSLRKRVRQAVFMGLGSAALLAGIAFYPIWTGIPIAESIWSRLMLFRSWI
ncbi:MAG: hypothetical protein C4318_01400 [Acidimicrobiia bacterium]